MALLAGCSSGSTNADDITAYSESPGNGLRRVVNAGDFRYSIQYKAPEYILRREMDSRSDAGAGYAERAEALKGMAWFNIRFEIGGYNESPLRYRLSEPAEYDRRLHYYLNEASRDIILVYGTDTLYPAAYGFDNNHNLTPHETIVAGFEIPEKDYARRDMVLSFYDRVARAGIIRATFFATDLNAVHRISSTKIH